MEETTPKPAIAKKNITDTSQKNSDGDQKPDVSKKFQEMAVKLGWFDYRDLNTALKSLSKSSKKKSSKPRTHQGKGPSSAKHKGKENRSDGATSERSQSKQQRDIHNGDTFDVTPPLSELCHSHTRHKLSFSSDLPLNELSTQQNVSSKSDLSYELGFPVQGSKGCTDLTHESKLKSGKAKTKKKLLTQTQGKFMESASQETVISSHQFQSSRFSFCPDDIGNPLIESTRIHSRKSVDNLLNSTNASNSPDLYVTTSPHLTTQSDSQKQSLVTHESSPGSAGAVNETDISLSAEDNLRNYLDKLSVKNHSKVEHKNSSEESGEGSELYVTAVCDKLNAQTTSCFQGEDASNESKPGTQARNNSAVCTLDVSGSSENSESVEHQSVPGSYVNNTGDQDDTNSGSSFEVMDSSLQTSLNYSVDVPADKKITLTDRRHTSSSGEESTVRQSHLTSDVDFKCDSGSISSSDSSMVEIQDTSVQTSTLSVSQHTGSVGTVTDGFDSDNMGVTLKWTGCIDDVLTSKKFSVSTSNSTQYYDTLSTKTKLSESSVKMEENEMSNSISSQDSSYVEVADNSLQTSNIDYHGNSELPISPCTKNVNSKSKMEDMSADNGKNKSHNAQHDSKCGKNEELSQHKVSRISDLLSDSDDEDLIQHLGNGRKGSLNCSDDSEGHKGHPEDSCYMDAAETFDTQRKVIDNDDNGYDDDYDDVTSHSVHLLNISDSSDEDGKENANKETDNLDIFKVEHPKSKVINLKNVEDISSKKRVRDEKSPRRCDQSPVDDSLPDLSEQDDTPAPNTHHWRTSRKYDTDSSDDDFEAFLQRMKTPSTKQEPEPPERSLKDFIVDDSDLSSSSSDEEMFHVNTDQVFVSPPKKREPRVKPTYNDDSDGEDFKQVNKIKRKTVKERNPCVDWESYKHQKKYKFLKSLTSHLSDDLCDREARRYVKNFKKVKEELTKKLFELYNETVFDYRLPKDLNILWNNRLLRTAGYCVYKRNAKVKDSNSVRIELSTKVCDSAERVRDTLIHELCHAAVWLLHGKNDGHGPYWKYWAKKANQVHPEIPIISRCHDYSIATKFTYQCSQCGYSVGRHSKSLDTTKKVCGYCHGHFVLLSNSGSRSADSMGSTPATPRTPNKFAMFVKENYGDVKKQDKNLKHGDIMRLLSKDFAEKNKI